MTTPGDTATPRPTFNPYALTTWHLTNLADSGTPDRPDRHGFTPDSIADGQTFDPSPGAEFLRSVAVAVGELLDYLGDDFDPDRVDDVDDGDLVHEVADGAPDVYTSTRWAEFADLAAYREDPAEVGGFSDDLTTAAGQALYMIAERLAWALLRDYAETLAEWIAEHEDDGAETVDA